MQLELEQFKLEQPIQLVRHMLFFQPLRHQLITLELLLPWQLHLWLLLMHSITLGQFVSPKLTQRTTVKLIIVLMPELRPWLDFKSVQLEDSNFTTMIVI